MTMADQDDAKSLSRERYGRLAQGYVESATHAKGADLDRLIEAVAPRADWVALDVATGGGHTALKLAPHVARVVATDLTPAMLAAARDFIRGQGAGNVDFQPADAESLPFEPASFDLVTCRIAAHHFPDCARFVAEGARVLRPGGVLWVQDHVLSEDAETARFTDGFEKLRDPSHHRAFPQSEWRTMFEAAGLAVELTEQVVKRHPFLPWARRQDCSAAVIERLETLLREAPPGAAEWLAPRDLGSPEASFVNRHLLILGRKAPDPPSIDSARPSVI
jgi:ubiquinone/menaquinone biosynthesis C-methylase UbiE